MTLERPSLDTLVSTQWDMIIIGGGITGAGICCEAARCGIKTLLLEQCDFAWGTSSRSSKMVHGGLRYLAQGHIGLTISSVHERERLLRELPGLVHPLTNLYPHYRGDSPSGWQVGLILRLYDAFAKAHHHALLNREDTLKLVPNLKNKNLLGSHRFQDGITDDARLVMRVLHEAVQHGAAVRNYTKVTGLLWDKKGKITGIEIQDTALGDPVPTEKLQASIVVNATGAWADQLYSHGKRLRPLRGSHLLIPSERCPVNVAVLSKHPVDGRGVMIYPWAGCTIIGTTDLDHKTGLQHEAAITPEEVEYLLLAADHLFPDLQLSADDIRSTWSGVRPIIDKGTRLPSRASREHAIWAKNGLITVTGGKLTTFRLMAHEVLDKAGKTLPALKKRKKTTRMIEPVEFHSSLPDTAVTQRLIDFYGKDVSKILGPNRDELKTFSSTHYLIAELQYILQNEAVIHLDDLLLRRTRIGLTCANGGENLFPAIDPLVKKFLGWSDSQWQTEKNRYQMIWKKYYYVC